LTPLAEAPDLDEEIAASGLPDAEADIVIIGAGLAGSLAALVIARRGMRVVMVDRHAAFPPEFRCEKFSTPQMALLRELDVVDCLSEVTQPYDRILVVRGGGSAGIQHREERGLTYCAMVNALRHAWPSCVTFLEGRVVHVATSPDRQRVTLADKRVIEARLVILATGLGDRLHGDLGLQRQIIRRAHSFCIGFDIAPGANTAFPFEAMTYFGEHIGDRIGYATFFPMKQGMRVNLFSYHDRQEEWLAAFRHDPIGRLREVMPGIAPFLGDAQLASPVEMRSTDLYETNAYERDGVVLIGDAFRSSCPATGTGVTRILTDIRQLCLVHLPNWFASAGMDAGKIASFYADPVKLTCDRRAARAAERARSLAIETDLRQRIERLLILLAFRLKNIRQQSEEGAYATSQSPNARHEDPNDVRAAS
jgi:2-polyprenyl-6-methoxyphenol hydroxylase-like FAD-dependent oxidoreductase